MTQGCGPCHLCFQPSSVPLRNQSQMTAAFVLHVRKIIERKLNLENDVPCWASAGSIENTPSVYSQTVKQLSPLSIRDSSKQNI